MSWIDDIQTRVQQLNDAVPKDIKDAFNKVAKDEFVKFGQKQLGNLTPLEIAQGQKGANANEAVSQDNANVASMNANQTSQLMSMGMNYLPFILVGGVAIYFLMKKRRG